MLSNVYIRIYQIQHIVIGPQNQSPKGSKQVNKQKTLWYVKS